MTIPRVTVIGGGPAGLSAAIHAARAGAAVTVFERGERCGVKLLATGGGRCNVTNTLPAPEWPARFGRRGRFLVPALNALPREALLHWFADMGQPLAAQDGFHFFPISQSAKQIRDAILAEATRVGVTIHRLSRIEKIHAENGRVAAVEDATNRYPCDRIVIATGGMSWPATGSTWDGCRMAESLGHTIRPAFPGLVGLRAGNLDPDLAGLILPHAAVTLKGKGRQASSGEGDLLLTHHGVSGPAVLDLSASVAEAMDGGEPCEIRIRWLTGADRTAWLERLAEWRRTKGGVTIVGSLRESLPQRLARWLCVFCGLEEEITAAALPAPGRDRLAEALGAFPLAVTGTEGWEKAMITRGGVDVREVRPETLESRLVSGLHFAGETLDMDGPCGGYNLHWAFASGALAGRAAADGSGPE